MKMEDIKAVAKKKCVKPGRMRKAELIRTIQRAEGNFDCFGTAKTGICDQLNCLWRKDCLNESQ